MDPVAILSFIPQQFPAAAGVLTLLGTLVVVGQAIIAWTPGKHDDEWWEAFRAKPFVGPLVSALSNFAVIQKKAPKAE